MQKNQLIKLAAKRSGLSQDVTGKAVNAFLEMVSLGIAAGQPVSLYGFGEFTQKNLPAMASSMNGTLAAKPVPARVSVGFRPSDLLKKRMNKGNQNG